MRTLYAKCPMCGSGPKEQVWDIVKTANCKKHPLWKTGLRTEIDWLKCPTCDHQFTSGYFEGEARTLLFSSANEAQEVSLTPIINGRKDAARIINKVLTGLRISPTVEDAKYQPRSTLRWLDYGFGSGALLATAEEYGIVATGAEARIGNVEAASAIGLHAIHAYSMTELAGHRYDVVSMMDVLEHTPYPLKELEAARDALRPAGRLYISCPNRATAAWRILDRANLNPYWGELEHYHNFTFDGLRRALLDLGFYDITYDVSHAYLAGMEITADYRSYPY